MKIKLDWNEFVAMAISGGVPLGEFHKAGDVSFYRHCGYEPDYKMSDLPDYVEIEVELAI